MSNPSRKTTCRSGHTLIELMTAVLIIGIISATAIPFYMSSVRRSNDQTQKIRLMLVRDAIEQHVAENDRQLPPANSELEFKKVIESYLGTEFPSVLVGSRSARQAFDPAGVAIDDKSPVQVDSSPLKGWKYDPATGHFLINLPDKTALDPNVGYWQW